jgi:hypothetical protein
MSFEKPPLANDIIDQNSQMINRAWAAWLTKLWVVVAPTVLHGTTAQRPIANLYVGMDYFDETLGYKVTLKSANPSVWVNGAGAVV